MGEVRGSMWRADPGMQRGNPPLLIDTPWGMIKAVEKSRPLRQKVSGTCE